LKVHKETYPQIQFAMSTSATTSILQILPNELVIFIIVEHLDPQTVIIISRVCKYFHQIYQQDFVWKAYAARDFPKSFAASPGATNWKQLFFKRSCRHIFTVNLSELRKRFTLGIFPKRKCDGCDSYGGLWCCLWPNCHHVGCSRYLKKHALSHSELTGHALVVSLGSIWCYVCNRFIGSSEKSIEAEKIAQILHVIA